jgi:hypothetical protein
MNATTNGSHFVPEGWHTVTPRIVVHDAKQLVEFLKHVFGATGNIGKPFHPRLGSAAR